MQLTVTSTINQLQKKLENYQKELQSKCEKFVNELAESGIEVAKQNTGSFGGYITFSVKTEPKKDGCKAIFYATETGKITNQWKTADGIKSADISPLLMVEFGSGWKAENPKAIDGVGQGTFPGQTHAFDKEGWYWIGLDDKLYHSYGITPKQPMFKASKHIENQVMAKAREIFGR